MVKLIELLGNKKPLQILLFLTAHPSQEFTYTELRKKTKLAKATLTKWLAFLGHQDLLAEQKRGFQKFYRINRNHVLVKQFKVLRAVASLDFLLALSKKHGFEAYLYGSAARGEEVEESDLDIIIIGKVKKEELLPEIQRQSALLKKEIRIRIFTPLEWAQLSDNDKAFYERVEKDKILLQ
ncbi:MAG: nucleotidyltransferase domain-containing protein [Nanoarchaeota archaeon]